MDEEVKSRSRVAYVILIWFGVLAIIILSWKYWFHPHQQAAAKKEAIHQQAVAEKEVLQQHQKMSAEFPKQDVAIVALTDEGWSRLKPITTLQIPKLVFARGGSKLNESSLATLEKLLEILNRFPRYYLLIQSSQSIVGDEDTNREIAESRAQAAAEYLINKGIDDVRIRTEISKQNGSTTVGFVLSEIQ